LEDVLVVRGWGMLVFDTVKKVGKRSLREGIVMMMAIEIGGGKKCAGCIKESVTRVSDGKLVDADSVDAKAAVECKEIIKARHGKVVHVNRVIIGWLGWDRGPG
jgi:hypothetical protein